MIRQLRSVAVMLVVAALLAGCSSPAVATVKAKPTATPKPATAAPSASAVPIPAGPYAVVVSNAARQGSTYDILLIDVAGQVVTRVTARLPLLKPNQTIQLPLVSASNDLAYYLDGDTDIRSLSPTGATALVKTISLGSSSVLAFAVSPDDQRVAVSLINQAANPSKDSSHGYVEDVADTANHVDLFSNTADAAVRWPVGWHGTDIVDAVDYECGGYGYGGPVSTGSLCAGSYHVISSSTGARRATVCETPATQPATSSEYDSTNGLPVAGGVACVETEYYNNGTSPPEGKILVVEWSGQETTVATADSTGNLAYGNCSLAPGGAQMACAANGSQALTLLAHGASPHNLGHRYNVLGWMDATHLLVDIDSTTLAVLTTDTGATVNLTLADADKIDMDGIQPGAL